VGAPEFKTCTTFTSLFGLFMDSINTSILVPGIPTEFKEERRPPKLAKKRWQPKKWEPLYDQIVALSCTGISNKAIAERFGYTPQQISNILCSDQAKIIKQLVTNFIRNQLEQDTGARLKRIEQRALENIETVITSEDVLAKHPLAMFDRCLVFLKGVGKLEGEKSAVPTQNIFIGAEAAKSLIDGMHKANEAHKLHNAVPSAVEVKTLPAR
jgi:hypothetical protein